MSWGNGDRTVVQIDVCSLNPDLYKYLTTLERNKRVAQYSLSYAEITRQITAGQDGFHVQSKNGQCYQTLPDP